jgi:hypothetical protein
VGHNILCFWQVGPLLLKWAQCRKCYALWPKQRGPLFRTEVGPFLYKGPLFDVIGPTFCYVVGCSVDCGPTLCCRKGPLSQIKGPLSSRMRKRGPLLDMLSCAIRVVGPLFEAAHFLRREKKILFLLGLPYKLTILLMSYVVFVISSVFRFSVHCACSCLSIIRALLVGSCTLFLTSLTKIHVPTSYTHLQVTWTRTWPCIFWYLSPVFIGTLSGSLSFASFVVRCNCFCSFLWLFFFSQKVAFEVSTLVYLYNFI